MLRIPTVSALSDHDLLDALARRAADDRHLTAELLALLGELDLRRLYLGQSCASLFTYCTQVLHFSEHAAYHRIEAARAARECPAILAMLAEGALTLTTVALLRPHLTRDNQAAVLAAARHKSKRDVEQQVACLAPKPVERSLLRRIPTPACAPASGSGEPRVTSAAGATLPLPAPAPGPARYAGAKVQPLSSDHFLLKVTLSAEAHGALRRAQNLMRHLVPNGDPAVVLERALTLLVAELERTTLAAARSNSAPARRSRAQSPARPRGRSRGIPAALRRAIWARDEGRCAFVGARGRCGETSLLEFHHLVPFADGGATTAENLSLRCRAHNQHEAELWSPTRPAPI